MNLKLIGGKRVRDRLEGAPKRISITLERDMTELGERIARAARARIGASGPSTLGSVSGDTRASINSKLLRAGSRFGKHKRLVQRTVVVVGPYTNPKGNLLRIHEEGLKITRRSRSGKPHDAQYARRPVLEPAVDAHRSEVIRRIGRIYRVV